MWSIFVWSEQKYHLIEAKLTAWIRYIMLKAAMNFISSFWPSLVALFFNSSKDRSATPLATYIFESESTYILVWNVVFYIYINQGPEGDWNI